MLIRKSIADKRNNTPTTIYSVFIDVIDALAISVWSAVALPKSANATMIGPIVVPKELTPPVRLSLCDPVEGSPSAMAKGLAEVCCYEKPKPIINNDTSIPANPPKLKESNRNNAPAG
ncbi:MAG: hypothetical protein J0I84_05905, partial [Terrimonas sp.]|nr:hypothetical protein [Terrimonas sp.]